MFDNLRDSASSFYEEEPNDFYKEPEAKPASRPKRRRSSGRYLGLTAQQRFILSVMFFLMVCVGGTFIMFVLGRMSLF